MINYNQIDLEKVKNEVIKYAAIEDSRFFILNEEVPFNPLVIKRNIKETNEFLSLIKKEYIFSFDGIENINDLFDKAKKDIILMPNEMSAILNFHNHSKRIKDLLNKIDDDLSIKDYTDSIFLNDELAKAINKVVDNNGNIKDDASSKLKQIIDDINTNEKKLYDTAHTFVTRHENSLQESALYIRDNRITVLVKNSDKNKFNGYAYGSSASGLASYIEPEVLVSLNNAKISLAEEKEKEITKILRELTYLVSTFADNYKDNFESLVKLDAVYAKAYYGFKVNGILANIVDDYFELKDIAHPLIDEKEVVTNTYKLQKPYKGIVISGTNTGGKTVGLKCIGLAVLLSYLGIPLIASSAFIPLYNNVYVDIDDNQSISNSLSTFSAHISNINNILNNANEKSLILIDELISGTDPKEAQAISLAILNKIEEIGSNFIITTHYDDIKNYAYKNESILLSSVGFDSVNLKPTYKYIENSVGASNALEIASRYFDDKSLIDYARRVIKENSNEQDKLLDKLSKEIENNQKLNNELDLKIKENLSLKEELAFKLSEFEKNKEVLKNKYINELNKYIDEIKEKAIDKLDSIKEKKQTNIIKEIEDLKEETIDQKVTFEVGDNVKVATNDRIGTITSLNGEKVEVNINGLNIKTNINNLFKMPKIVKKEYKNESRKYDNVSHEIVLVGKHIDEALEEMEVYLDRALRSNLSQVKIIHGIGTGQLKNAIREKLKKLRFVKSFSDGDYNDGGSAVTMVKLK